MSNVYFPPEWTTQALVQAGFISEAIENTDQLIPNAMRESLTEELYNE